MSADKSNGAESYSDENERSGGISTIESPPDDQHLDTPASGSTEVPRFARLAGWFGFFLPPIGAVMGHLWLAWEGKDKSTPGRRHAVTGVIVGWFMTFALLVGGLVGFTLWFEAAEAERIQQSREEITQQELADVLEAAQGSPSTGEVDVAACDAIFAVVNPETPPEELSDLVDGYEAIAASETPNAESYTAYAEYLDSFESAEQIGDLDEAGQAERDEQAEAVLSALDEDSLGCVDLDEDYFLDNVADRNTIEF